MTITRRPATAEDAVWVGMHLREADIQEVLTVRPGRTPVEATVSAFLAHPEDCWAMLAEDSEDPIALFGCVPDGEAGIIWLLGTDRIRGRGISIARATRPWLDQWNTKYPLGLHTLVDSRNDLHVRWCRLAGFQTRASHDVNGTPFYHIIRPPEAHSLV